jgi:hypothetical protein
MKKLIVILLSITSMSYGQSSSVEIANNNYKIIEDCLSIEKLAKSDTIDDPGNEHICQFKVKNLTKDTIYIKQIFCQASDQMPKWNKTYLLSNQIDTITIVSNFRYLEKANGDPFVIKSRTVKIETSNCEQSFQMKFYVKTFHQEFIQSNMTTYESGDTLIVTSNGLLSSGGSDTPNVHWGLERKTEEGWLKEVDLILKPKNCRGPGHLNFQYYVESISIFNDKNVIDRNYYTINKKGTYRVYTTNYDGKFIYSNEFSYKTKN